MRFKRILTATAALVPLITLATACEDPDRAAPRPAGPAAAGAAPAPAAPGGTDRAPASLAEVQAYLQKFTSCERLGTDPNDSRLPATDDTKDGDWAVTGRGVCTDVKRHGEILIYLVSDMKTFQQAYYDHTMKEIGEGNGEFGIFSRTIVGKGFVAVPAKTGTAVDLVASDLRVLTCNPGFSVPAGYKKEKPLVDHCGLTDFVSSKDGEGSRNLEVPHDPSTEGAEKPGQPATGSLGLASAGSLAELKKLVSPHTVDCTSMAVTDEHVESIDYQPVVGREGPRAWGVRERAVCGQLGGAQRAHDLNWLDTVSDMKTLQSRAKAAQLADLADDGRLRATASKLLVGTDVAVESNNKDVRFGLYQLQFLYLNCETGFTAPAGYRLERAQVEGCVLTNFER
ncbi:hypothetical protein ACFZBM_07645 [Streptomyces lavendulae]|uniref:Uncharacterized protein n=1 Tax=Streptomyces lavendulae subsp. lavendulae TaxID=58340 RepID=A0A2K8PDL6_STRLA|nr:hypothetical protein [Streptomyces lavendulae]ATZ24809.1 hypothetical protein SLAV_14775 [Streptomyces lavendulae subsp. lavendulae]QUQ54640.1 hypothetical protein SLLC_12840 [Streptomyces lavendulae subsp. lavendulae]GLV98882.1 hypothetical protein Slala05_25140 [Streptomyces lavendulae subsp. lavendulae]